MVKLLLVTAQVKFVTIVESSMTESQLGVVVAISYCEGNIMTIFDPEGTGYES